MVVVITDLRNNQGIKNDGIKFIKNFVKEIKNNLVVSFFKKILFINCLLHVSKNLTFIVIL